MITKCPKCSYIRNEKEFVPDYECPSCGIIYEKYNKKKIREENNIKDDQSKMAYVEEVGGGITIQNIIVASTAIIVIIMVMFPPFHLVTTRATINQGYSFILSPPFYSTIDSGTLFVQLFATCVLGGLLFFLLKNSKVKFFKNNNNKQFQSYEVDNIKKQIDQEYKKIKFKNTHPWRRFCARTIDICTLGIGQLLLLNYVLALQFPVLFSILRPIFDSNEALTVLLYILWIPTEALFISLLGATPAKWIFGISVLNESGEKLSFLKSLERTYSVCIVGDGLGLIAPLTRIAAYYSLKKNFTTHWDRHVNSIVTHKHWGFIRSTVCTLIAISSFIFMFILKSIPITK